MALLRYRPGRRLTGRAGRARDPATPPEQLCCSDCPSMTNTRSYVNPLTLIFCVCAL